MTTRIPWRRLALFVTCVAAIACSSDASATGPVRVLTPSDILGRWVLHDIDGNAPSSGKTYPGVTSDTVWFQADGTVLDDEHDVDNPNIPQVDTWWTIKDSLVLIGPPTFQPDTFRLARTSAGAVLTLVFNWTGTPSNASGRSTWNYRR